MESSASSSVLCNSCFLLYQSHPPPSPYLLNPLQFLHHHSHFPPLSLTSSTTAAASLSFRPRVSKLDRLLVARSSPPGSSGSDCSPSGEQFAIVLEVDGVLLDAYRSGNRLAFNVAFKKLGLDCANWTKPVYSDLVRKAPGDEEGMLILFFNRIGWPTSLPTAERETFIQKLLQEKKNALDELVISKDLPLRPGVEKFDAQFDDLDELFDAQISLSLSKSCHRCFRGCGPDSIEATKQASTLRMT